TKQSSRRPAAVNSPILSIVWPCFDQNCIESLAVRRTSGNPNDSLEWTGKGAPMNSAPNPEAIDPNDVLVARADERLAHAYEQIARADEQLVRFNEQLSKLDHDAARRPSAVLGRGPSRGRP